MSVEGGNMLLRDDDSYGRSMLRFPPLVWQRMLSVPQPPVSTLRAVVLLGGNVSPTALRSAVRRSLLDLPVERRLSLSQFWCRQIDQLRAALPGTQLTVRVVHDRRCPAPSMPPDRGMLRVRIEQDPCDWRGTGGLVRDNKSVSYTHLTLPTICSVQISVVVGPFKNKKDST
eukprot:TRINITY_DN8187_c0_g1_i2.p1 TRINITY_DN8187_c0_g1~~TRINITY_DN8187_c0_g1_i2.p1  ORF type:complete len:172 (-),score=12.05 TRINITY_DN8187_c0_g1_i2:25-540(-)